MSEEHHRRKFRHAELTLTTSPWVLDSLTFPTLGLPSYIQPIHTANLTTHLPIPTYLSPRPTLNGIQPEKATLT